MESVSNSVKRIVDRTPFLYEMLIQGILSYSNYANSIHPQVEKLHGKSVKSSAIVMAVRRYGEELKKKELEHKSTPLHYEIVMKTNIYDINLIRNHEVLEKMKELFILVDPSSGDFLNISVGSHEISLSISEKYVSDALTILKGETVLHQEGDLVALSLVFSGDFYVHPRYCV